MTHDEYESLFLATIEDIKAKLAENTPYSITRASGLLRHLLLDAYPLVHLVNRKYKLKLEFETTDFTTFAAGFERINLRPTFCWQNLEVLDPNWRRLRVSLKDLLGATCFFYKQHYYSVADVIKACAHMKGGIHSQQPKDEKDEVLLALDEFAQFGNLATSLESIRQVVVVTLRGLEPLVNAIESNRQAAPG